MTRALEMMVVEGIKTSIPMHLRILADPDFRAGRMSTGFMERFLVPAKTGKLAESPDRSRPESRVPNPESRIYNADTLPGPLSGSRRGLQVTQEDH